MDCAGVEVEIENLREQKLKVYTVLRGVSNLAKFGRIAVNPKPDVGQKKTRMERENEIRRKALSYPACDA